MYHGTVSSRDLGGRDNSTGRLSASYLLLVQGLKASERDMERLSGLLARFLSKPQQRTLTGTIRAAESPAEIQTQLQALLGLPNPSPELQAGLAALARHTFALETARVEAEATALAERAARMRASLHTAAE